MWNFTKFLYCKLESKYKQKKVIVAVFLDFKRAFETIDRNILISKPKSYGIIGTEANLQDRRQQTFYDTACSPPILNMNGVP